MNDNYDHTQHRRQEDYPIKTKAGPHPADLLSTNGGKYEYIYFNRNGAAKVS
jgi:hypothetical protein